jgi:hypothetical protein
MAAKSGENKVVVAPKGKMYDENYEKIFGKKEVPQADNNKS